MDTSVNRLRFFSDQGIEVPAVTAAGMLEVDRIALEETGPNLYQMMENAGRNLAALAMEILGQRWREAQIAVLAGSGGNGGGGVCAARHLANRGMDVKLCVVAGEHLGGVLSFQRKAYSFTRGQQIELNELRMENPDLILDALIGYGLNQAPRGIVAELIRWANHLSVPILALDIPSGLDATTGDTPGEFIRPRWTMTLALPKTGLLPDKTGELFLADIGIPPGTYDRAGLAYTPPFGSRYYVPVTCRQ